MFSIIRTTSQHNYTYLNVEGQLGKAYKYKACGHVRKLGGGVNPLSATKQMIFFFKEKKMQNVVKRKNMYLEGFQVILNSFPHNHMFYSILNLLFYIMKNYFKKNSNFLSVPAKIRFLSYGRESESYYLAFFDAFPYFIICLFYVQQ